MPSKGFDHIQNVIFRLYKHLILICLIPNSMNKNGSKTKRGKPGIATPVSSDDRVHELFPNEAQQCCTGRMETSQMLKIMFQNQPRCRRIQSTNCEDPPKFLRIATCFI